MEVGMTHLQSILFVCAFLFSNFLSASPVNVFTDELLWKNSLGHSEYITESFNGEKNYFEGNSLDNSIGDFAIDLLGGLSDTGPTGLNGYGFFKGELDAGSDPLSLNFNFTDSGGFALLGLQNDSKIEADANNLSLDEIVIAINDSQWVLSDLVQKETSAIDFLGFSSDVPINSFSLFHAASISPMSSYSEGFFLDGLVLSKQVSSVPAPASFWLFVSGLLVFKFRLNKGRSGQEENK